MTGWVVAKIPEDGVSADWYERFPGHFFLEVPDWIVHVCARGPNLFHPVAIIERLDYSSLLWEKCKTVKEAMQACEEYLKSCNPSA
jgi:hypothetical protein